MKLSTKLGAALGTAALIFAGAPAGAGGFHDRVVSKSPADWVPIVEDGAGVWGSATVGDTTVVGGSFDHVRERDGSRLARHHIFAFDSDGNVSRTFRPDIATRVWDIIPAGDGVSVYVGGQFNRVNGEKRTSRVARINVNTGEVMTSFRSPGFNNIVTDLHLANGRLYVGGYFKVAGGQPHVGLVALNPDTGALTNHLDQVTFGGIFRDAPRTSVPSGRRGTGVERFAMTPDGDRLVAIGNFRTVSGQSRVQVAMIDTSAPQATVTNWSTTRYAMACSQNFPTYTLGLDVSPDGEYFAIGTGGAYNGGVNSGTLCDTVARWEIDASGPNQQPTWVNYFAGDTTTAIGITGSAVYAGGHFRWVNSPFAGDRAGPGAVGRKGMAALDPRNGLPLTFNAGKLPLRWGVTRFNSDEQGLWVNHDGDRLNGETTGRMGLLPLNGGKAVPADDTGSLPGDAYLAGGSLEPPFSTGGDALVRTGLTETAATDRAEAANGGIDWSNVRGTFMVDRRLYIGWADGTFTWRPMHGNASFGSERNINLRGLTAFSAELPNVRGMWFDRDTGRMYFTLRGQSGLFYRYFTPESNTVGAVRFTAPTSAGVNWCEVTGGFLANGKLYYSSTDENLRSATWQQDGSISGSPTTVSGPSVDSREWGSGSLFLHVR